MSNKVRILNRKPIEYLFHHILHGFKSSHLGIRMLVAESVITKDEYIQLLEKNCERLISRVKEFEVAQKLMSLFFACLFAYMQMNDQGLEMRRSRRGRRRNESEQTIIS